MRPLEVLAIAAALLVGFGCGQDRAAGPEATAKAMFEGLKTGDPEPFLDGIDLRDAYAKLAPDQNRPELSYAGFVAQLRERMQQAFAASEGFDYRITGSKKQGELVIVTISVKENANAEWATNDIAFKKIGGKWKMTAEGLQKIGEQE